MEKPTNPDEFSTSEPTGLAWVLMKTHFASHKSGKTEYAGLASWVLNSAIRKKFPNCDVKAACAPLIEMNVVHIRPTKGGVIYHEGAGREAKTSKEADELLRDAGIS